ncbi:hypothetical protein PTSG_02425 [Salpingoeca rosetta]|uniref:Uncharacterized protein n=1 Tax=Salpingoeca rosetta (strain ATCC 50818 / BSB-021) TaxID=946362 RepID=F2U262_SALR5|nr:uncharacterized protein PTSG_02425 [Salpingoeca rosetta]EGD81714.1 hypothetical protein PTSG_02425 [Salpingoeca rosetta]|eukprot:XP_004996918.1 hypothetical protein PTSG_02425 [Salpingoeca rosetta]
MDNGEFRKTDDLVSGKDALDEDKLNAQLEERYNSDIIYTYVGDILVAVNPYQMLPLYTPEIALKYCDISSKADFAPHLYAIAVGAYNAMMRNSQPQVTVISGESGAGKTESTKHFMRQIMMASSRRNGGGDDDGPRELHPVEQKIIQTNPILEAFGNAQTVMNDNSSRFGKFIELKFSPIGMVVGASMSHYLLEKARVVKQGPGERNYHIFELLLAGGDLGALKLAGISQFKYLASRRSDMDNLKAEYTEVIEALGKVGFTNEEIEDIQRILATVLLLGNFEFKDTSSDKAEITTAAELEKAAANLGVEPEKLRIGFMTKRLEVVGQAIIQELNITDVQYSRDAVSKALYDRLFTWLVTRLDIMLCPNNLRSEKQLTIGMLDIFGFEDFKANGFDQMCINLANERLHHFFNEHIFASEIAEYKAEGIEGAESVFFEDNDKILDLFFSKVSLLSILNEETNFPGATDQTLMQKLTDQLKDQEALEIKPGGYAFVVKHYAGGIEYQIEGMIEKNKDPLPNQMAPNMEAASNSVAHLLFKPNYIELTREAAGANAAPEESKAAKLKRKKTRKKSRRGKKARALPTVSFQFRTSLDQLMTEMNRCIPHFVRCIKPNLEKKPKMFVGELVKKQLKYTGMLQTIEMRREGFPVRLEWGELLQRYQGIAFPFSASYGNSKDMAIKLMKTAQAKQEEIRKEKKLTARVTTLDGWKPANSKMFLKYWHTDVLETLLKPFDTAIIKVQALARRFIARCRYVPMLQKYHDQMASIANFLVDVRSSSGEIHDNLQTLISEEKRRGPKGLGLLKEVSAKDEAKAKKKMMKEAGKIVKEAGKKVDVKKAQAKAKKDLNKKQKVAASWWNKYERKRRAHLDSNGETFPWFHGLISRKEAENFLYDEDDGTFLIRVSERANGYAISLKFKKRVNHYKIAHSDNGGYIVHGSDEDFGDLEELVKFYHENDVSSSGDRLVSPLYMEHDLGLDIGLSSIKGAPAGKVKSYDPSFVPRNMEEDDVDESKMDPLIVSDYLEGGEHNKPSWLRGSMSRDEAEKELLERGQVDGRFLVRERARTRTTVTFAISYAYERKFYHHLLKKKKHRNFSLNNRPLKYQYLEQCVRKFQEVHYPGFATRLEADAPPVSAIEKSGGKKKNKKGKKGNPPLPSRNYRK